MTGKLLILTTAFFSLVIFAHYEADLTTSMTVRDKKVQIALLEELLHSEYLVHVLHGTAQHGHMQSASQDTPLGGMNEAIAGKPERLIGAECNSPCQAKLLQVGDQVLKLFNVCDILF